eukprot:jgi/Chlat1/2541/Chrsp175S02394
MRRGLVRLFDRGRYFTSGWKAAHKNSQAAAVAAAGNQQQQQQHGFWTKRTATYATVGFAAAGAVAAAGAYTYGSCQAVDGRPQSQWLAPLTALGSLTRPNVAIADAQDAAQQKKPRLVVLGTGWGAVSVLKELDVHNYDVTVVSPRNYFLMTPLLPGMTVGTVENRSVIEPIRRLLRRTKSTDARYFEAECVNIDPETKKIACVDRTNITAPAGAAFSLDYDLLVISVGAQNNTFNTPGVNEYCLFLKEVPDAREIRGRIIDCFETAVLPGLTDEQRQVLLHFVVVGGGPTGVEFAAELNDFLHEDLARLYPETAGLPMITIVQSGDHILNSFDASISTYAEKKFARDAIDVRTNQRVTAVYPNHIVVAPKANPAQTVELPFGLCVWSTGIGTIPLVAKFMEKIDQEDRRAIATDEWLRVRGCKGVYALGDCATITGKQMHKDAKELFNMADTENSGTVSLKEFEVAMEALRKQYPQIDIYLQRETFQNLLNEFCDKTTDVHELNIKDFTRALKKVDSQMKNLPATAQVAAQQGRYLGKLLNKATRKPALFEQGTPGGEESGLPPFKYRFLGQFATIGGGEASAETGFWHLAASGVTTMWLWYAAYASMQVSWRTRCLVVMDWMKKQLFGRDTSRI